MLRALHIRDFIIIEQAEIHFDLGFTVFSGETGAGKSILIDALSLALGTRGDLDVVRPGAQRTDISAVFDLSFELREWLSQQEIDADDELILRRVIDCQGRSRALINGVPATIAQLRAIGENLVDIHGQHAHQSLLRAGMQRELLDAYGQHGSLREDVAKYWKIWQTRLKQLETAQTNTLNQATEREYLEWQVNELAKLDLQENEWESLQIEQTRLAHAQTLLEGIAQIIVSLDENENSAQRQINIALNRVTSLLRHDPSLEQASTNLESARIALVEAISDLNAASHRIELDPQRLNTVEKRLANVFNHARKFKTDPNALYLMRHRLTQRLAQMQAMADIEQLQVQSNEAQAQYEQKAQQLGIARAQAAKKLEKLVTQAMQRLAMNGGNFSVALTPITSSAYGNEQVDFLVSSHPGLPPKPLAKVVSGGELSRISLSLAVITSHAAQKLTLIFDEVDSGVGGAVAEVVGKLLQDLGQTNQVLCVTHLPQVAARANTHYQVSKTDNKNKVLLSTLTIKCLDKEQRIEELARMLGGVTLTTKTREHAAEMLAYRS